MSYNPQFAKLGEILVNEDIITEKELEKGLAEQKKKKGKLGNVLVASGIITEDQLVQAFSLQLGSKSIKEDELLKAPEDTVKLLPEDFAKENNVITLKKTSNSIYVAMASDGIYTIFWMAEMMRMIILLVIWEFQQLKIHLPTMQLEIPMNSSRL